MKKTIILISLILIGFDVSKAQNEAKVFDDSNKVIAKMDSSIYRKMENALDSITLKDYSKKILERINDLGVYISLIIDSKTDLSDVNSAIDLACELFISDSAKVEVSNVITKKVIAYTIKEYLYKLKLLRSKYDQIKVTWSKIHYVSKLRRGPDGNYYGNVSIQQVFTASRDNAIQYVDVTEKNINVILKGNTKITRGEIKSFWEVFLSDIGVVETRKS